MDNLQIYNAVRAVPQEAQKEIKGGRMAGKTDINPVWRIKKLTEQFGPCGIGWRYTIDEERLETYRDEVAAFVRITLYVKADGQWSEGIPGTGGNMFVANERNGLHVSDECFKMALTDAISVACKALGIGADVYWSADKTKYDRPSAAAAPQQATKPPEKPVQTSVQKPDAKATKDQMTLLLNIAQRKGYTQAQVASHITRKYGDMCSLDTLTDAQFTEMFAGYKDLPDKAS